MHTQSSLHFFQTQNPRLFLSQSLVHLKKPHLSFLLPCSAILKSRNSRLVASCISPGQELTNDRTDIAQDSFFVKEEKEEEDIVEGDIRKQGLENQSLWQQIKEIVMFTAPATGLWICGPLMSLIDTAVIGQGSSLELAALGPGTVLCDNMSYVFMFLSISTSNMVATSLAKQDKNEVQHQLAVLLFIGLTCGFLMILFTKFFGMSALTAFTGSKNLHIVPVANTYVQDADAEGSIFHNATLRECEFTGANLRGALLAGANLHSASLQGPHGTALAAFVIKVLPR